ncbi:KilA-N domain-containing protein [Pseudomonas sp. NPDC088368]|uniref:KilA-N domain-containing protein n=1 Tax=Pseudomonas sp. NPDC088368 TaxID=3364453 RepID=UPI0037F881D5
MSALVIAGIEIHQDQDSRFSLNDFHRAAGGEKRHAPNEWMRIGQAKELAEEIGKTGIPGLRTARGGRAPGTYACKELVYAYAMWISPAFSLHVIRSFDSIAANDGMTSKQLTHDESAVAFAKLALEHLPNLGDTSKQALLSHVSELAYGQRLLPLPKVEEALLSAGKVGELLGVSGNKIGRLANANDMKIAAYGEFRLDKSRHSSKQVETFLYNGAAIERFRVLLS